MAKQRDKRLDDLERDTGPGDQINISVNWGEPGQVLDADTGEYVTEQEWKRRHPKDRLIIVTWDDIDDDQEPIPVPV